MNKKIIKRILVAIVILITGFVTLMKVNFLDYEKPITYDKIDKITFENFRGLEFFRKSLYGNEHFAYVKTSIDFDFETDSIRIESYFHPSSSYVYNNKTYSKDLLTHEMYHFRITELYTRIAKKKISEVKNANKAQIKDIINQIENEENQFQIKYDDDTFHSYVLSEQKKYEKNVDSLLSLHSNFKKPKIFLNEK